MKLSLVVSVVLLMSFTSALPIDPRFRDVKSDGNETGDLEEHSMNRSLDRRRFRFSSFKMPNTNTKPDTITSNKVDTPNFDFDKGNKKVDEEKGKKQDEEKGEKQDEDKGKKQDEDKEKKPDADKGEKEDVDKGKKPDADKKKPDDEKQQDADKKQAQSSPTPGDKKENPTPTLSDKKENPTLTQSNKKENSSPTSKKDPAPSIKTDPHSDAAKPSGAQSKAQPTASATALGNGKNSNKGGAAEINIEPPVPFDLLATALVPGAVDTLLPTESAYSTDALPVSDTAAPSPTVI